MIPQLKSGDALIIVDVKNDFCPRGALPVPEGDQVVSIINEWIEAAQAAGAPIFASRDWHPPGHISFREQGGPWPEHCAQNSYGAEYHADLKLSEDTVVINKAQQVDKDANSAFDGTALAELLKEAGLVIMNIVDICLGGHCSLSHQLDGIRRGFAIGIADLDVLTAGAIKGPAAEQLPAATILLVTAGLGVGLAIVDNGVGNIGTVPPTGDPPCIYIYKPTLTLSLFTPIRRYYLTIISSFCIV